MAAYLVVGSLKGSKVASVRVQNYYWWFLRLTDQVALQILVSHINEASMI